MITDQKNYVHAKMKHIEDKKKGYASIIQGHRNELMNLIKNTGDERIAENTQKQLNNSITEINKRRKELIDFLSNPIHPDLYNKFVESTLIDITNIVLKSDMNLYQYKEHVDGFVEVQINPDTIYTSSTTGVKQIEPTKYKHYLSTVFKRIKKIFNTIVELKKQKDNRAAQEMAQVITERYRKLRDIYFQVQNEGKHTLYKNTNNQLPTTSIINGKEIELVPYFEEAIADITRFFSNAQIIFRLQKRLSEQMGQDIINHINKLGEKITDQTILNCIEQSSAANEKVKVSAELEYGAIGKLHGPTASQGEYKSITKKIDSSGKYNDFYINFGKEEVDNKIDYYITINNNNNKNQVGISHKSYNLATESDKKEYQNITFASTLNLLSLILGMGSIDKSYAFLNTIAPAGKNRYRVTALDTLKRQAIYAGMTGHLGGRQLLNGEDKAEYLVVEDSSSGKYYIYAMSTLIGDAKYKYIDIEPDSPSPFTKNGYRNYFENNYVESQSGKPNWVAAWQRNTLLLLKLRQTKLHISLDKSHIKNGKIRLMDKSNMT